MSSLESMRHPRKYVFSQNSVTERNCGNSNVPNREWSKQNCLSESYFRMVKLTADLIAESTQHVNPCRERIFFKNSKSAKSLVIILVIICSIINRLLMNTRYIYVFLDSTIFLINSKGTGLARLQIQPNRKSWSYSWSIRQETLINQK